MSGRFKASALAIPADGVLDFSSNLNPLGTPVQIVRAVKVAATEISGYPDPLCANLVEALAERESMPANQIVATAGATDAFVRIATALRPHKALLCTPSYSGYERALRQIHAQIVHHSLVARENFDVTERIIDYIEPDIDMVFICTPNNPTGRVVSRELICKILRAADRWGTWVVIDESYLDFTHEHTAATLLDRYPRLIVVKSFTASYAMAGIRAGWCVCGSKDTADLLRDAGLPWIVSAPAQAAAIAALDIPGYLDLTRDYIDDERERLDQALRKAGMLTVPSQANFILFQGTADLGDRMRDRKIKLRFCGDFRGLDATWFRTAVRTTEENNRFIAALKR